MNNKWLKPVIYLFGSMILGLIGAYCGVMLHDLNNNSKVHRIYLTVLSPERRQITDAELTFTDPSPRGIIKKVLAGGYYGWEYDTGAPVGTKIKISVDQVKDSFLVGETEITLTGKAEQNITLETRKDQSAAIKGVVVRRGVRVPGVKLVVNKNDLPELAKAQEITDQNGYFEFPVKVSNGQMIRIAASKGRCEADTYYHAFRDYFLTVYLNCDPQ